jgi:hypothetical protein
MEETSHRRQPPLKVVREFAGSRLEQQVRIRTYELAAPVLRKPTNVAPASSAPSQQSAHETFQSHPIAKGA